MAQMKKFIGECVPGNMPEQAYSKADADFVYARHNLITFVAMFEHEHLDWLWCKLEPGAR